MGVHDEIDGLLRKYEEIVRLRRLEETGHGGDPRRAMAALASEFPGALREADDLPMAELTRRVEALRRVRDGGEPAATWMHTMARFHALTRGALCAKRWLGGRKQLDPAATAAFDVDAKSLCYADEAREWRLELEALANPPRGRLTRLVFERMGRELDVPPDEVENLVFGRGRTRPMD